MTRSKLDTQLKALNAGIIKMGSMAETAIQKSIKALTKQDAALAMEVIEEDKKINDMMTEVEGIALRILLMQQPVARDLRTITTALKIIADIERIGDQAADICAIVENLCEYELYSKLVLIPQMAEMVKSMVKLCIDAFVRRDVALAAEVITMDDEVDDLFDTIRERMIAVIKDRTQFADQALYLMMITKHLEKIGDHAENIAARIIFSETGEYKGKTIL
ncbi:MAG: phosphate signaling complex protein PhoU [Firmicutes bacterium]|nr:phosphate signaling complex protein PhoU [Bacillota bacterium]